MDKVNTGEPTTTWGPKDLIDGRYPTFAKMKTILAAEVLVESQVVALQTATQKIIAYDGGGSGGAEVAYGILVDATDATAGDTSSLVWLLGVFNKNKLTATGEAVTMEDELRSVGILLESWGTF